MATVTVELPTTTAHELMREITALRAELERERALLRRRDYHGFLQHDILTLRAALEQERADCEKLRAFAQSSLYVLQSGRGDIGMLVEYRRYNLLDDNGNSTALLSGRGEGR